VGKGSCKKRPPRGQVIDMGSLYSGAPITTQPVRPERVDRNEQNIESVFALISSGSLGRGKQCKEKKCDKAQAQKKKQNPELN
jgi:hypothetical protein